MPTSTPESSAQGPDDHVANAEAAEQLAAEAEARAEAARARADELRRKLAEARGQICEGEIREGEIREGEAGGTEPTESEPSPPDLTSIEVIAAPERRQRRMPRRSTILVSLGAVVTAGLLGATGYMVWQNTKATDLNQRTAEFSAAARQGVVNLMSMDYNAAKESVQRVIDDSTGKFHEDVADSADDMIKAMEASKVVTTVTVNDAAVESISGDSAVVLVAATSEKHDATAPPDAGSQPRVWRVVVTVARDGGQLKVSDVEFV